MRVRATNQASDPLRILLAGTESWLGETRAALAERSNGLDSEDRAGGEDRIEFVVVGAREDAMDVLGASTRPVDGVVVARTLDGEECLALLERIPSVAPTVPVVVHPERGDETFASATLKRGAVDYVPASERDQLCERVLAAIRQAKTDRRNRQLSERFEATFDDPHRYAWVLDLDGAVVTANHTAYDLIDAGTDPIENVPFTESPWCHPDTAPAVDRAVEDAANGRHARVEVTGLFPGNGEHVFEVAARPVRDRRGGVRELLLEAEDAARRSNREAALRQSEHLHRITLNNMTDTVLVTDDDGEFVYVCPNVHFIFGYTDEEVHELGGIEELLGGDPFEPGRLDDEGVLTNLEYTTTDKEGNERTLLVNVKEVSIQGGTRLYSCRDVTKRKERERALTTLHSTARDLLYAETAEEIAHALVADATVALSADGAAFYRFDGEDALLRPIVVTRRFERLHGPLPALATDDNSIVGRVFIDGEPTTFGDVRETERLTNPATDLRGCTYVPISEYGVLVVGSKRADVFDPIATEVAEVVAATAEAAFDRVQHMADLRERDRELKSRNERLAKLNRINDLIREIDRAVVQADTRGEIERAVCEQLTSAGRFGFAWIADGDPPKPRAIGDGDSGYLDAVRADLVSGEEPTAATFARGEPVVVRNVAEALTTESWRRAALERGFQSVVAVPLDYEGVSYGTLAVYATETNAFDEVTRDVIVELGETVASAIGALERKAALLEGTTTELEYETADRSCVLYAIARRADCAIALEGPVQQVEDGVLAFLTVGGTPVERVAEIAAEFTAVEEAQVVDGGTERRAAKEGAEGTLRLRLSSPFVATTLADHGIVLRHLAADPDTARIVLDVPGSVGTRTADEVLGTVYENRTLLAQRERPRSLGTEQLRATLLDRLTDRQLEVARTAYHGGYYGYPRESTGEEVAAALDVSPATFYQTNQRILRTLFEQLFEDTYRPDDDFDHSAGSDVEERTESRSGKAVRSSSEDMDLDN